MLLSALCFPAVSILSCHCLCCPSSVSPSLPCLSPLSPADSGAWIPPPAQRSGLQSLPAAAGHRHPLRGHQTVSFTPVNSFQGGIRVSCLNMRQASLMSCCDAAKSLSAVHMGTCFRCLIFPRCCSTPAWHSQTVESVSPFAQFCSFTERRSQSVHSPH